jgi:hypothetical protein
VQSVVVLLRPKATATDLTGLLEIPDANGVPYHTFRYTVIRLWQESVNALLSLGAGLAPLALLTNEAAADLTTAFRRFDERLRATDVSATLREKLVGASFVLNGLRYTDAQIEGLYMSLDEILEDSTTYQLLIRRGKAQVILAQGRKRFGPPPPSAEAMLKGIRDSERLDRMAECILDAAGWDELLATE